MHNSDVQKMIERLDFLNTALNLIIGCGMIYYGTNQEINTFARICLLVIAIVIIFLEHYTTNWKKELEKKYNIPDEIDESTLKSSPTFLLAFSIMAICIIAIFIFFVFHLHFNLWFILGIIYTIIILLTIFFELITKIIENLIN